MTSATAPGLSLQMPPFEDAVVVLARPPLIKPTPNAGPTGRKRSRMTTRHTMQRLAEPLRIECSYGNTPGPAEGGKRRTGAQPLTSSTSGVLDGGEGTTRHRTRQPCISPFAHDD
jgi:hypothetical protein